MRTAAAVLWLCCAIAAAQSIQRGVHGAPRLLARARRHRHARAKHRNSNRALTPRREGTGLERRPRKDVASCHDIIVAEVGNYNKCRRCGESQHTPQNIGKLVHGNTKRECAFCSPANDGDYICTSYPDERHGMQITSGGDCKGNPVVTDCAATFPHDTDEALAHQQALQQATQWHDWDEFGGWHETGWRDLWNYDVRNDVLYDDGDSEQHVPREFVRLVLRV